MMKTEKVFRGVTPEDLPQVAGAIISRMEETRVWLFAGDLGAGKTTLIKVAGQLLGVDEMMSSPSFSIVNEYHSTRTGKIFHFDFYRIRNEAEATDIGVDEYFYSGHPCLIEWPEKIPGLIPVNHGEVRLTIEDEHTRTIAISVHDGKEENRV